MRNSERAQIFEKLEMFFSKDLLAIKTSPFHRIWLLAHKDEKFKPADLKLSTIKIADSLLEWLKAQDSRRTALPLSADLALGLSRALCHQTLALKKDIQALKDEFKKKTDQSIGAQIDAAEVERVSILTAPPDVNSFGPQAQLDQITLREDPIDLPVNPTPDFGDDQFFGDNGYFCNFLKYSNSFYCLSLFQAKANGIWIGHI